MKKVLYTLAAVLGITLLTLSSLLLTHTGNALIWHQMTQSIAALDGEMTAGQLLSGWTFKNLSWRDKAVDFRVNHLQLDWQLSKLLDKKLPVALIDLQQGYLQLKEQDTSEASKPESPPLNIPLDIVIEAINIQTFEFQSSAAQVLLGSLSTDAQLINNRLAINSTKLDQLQINIPESAATETTANKQVSTPVQLPAIEAPLPIKLGELVLTDGTFQKGSISESINRSTLSFNWQETHIHDLKLTIDHSLASTSLVGNINLSGHYPLTVLIETKLHQPLLDGMLAGEQLALKTSGDLTQLQFDLEGKGPVSAILQGRIAPLTPDLPFYMTLNWQNLSWPLNAAPKQITTQYGQLTVKGDLNAYNIDLGAYIEVPGQPATQIVLNGEGNATQLDIKQLLLKEKTGHLELNGKLDWQEGIHWEGNTTLVDLNPGLWLPDVPGKLNGSLNSRFSLDNDTWNASVPTLIIKGRLKEYPVNIAGNIEAKQADNADFPIDLVVNHLSATMGDNTLTANGQLAEQWNLQAKLDAPSLEQLHPDLQGAIGGHFTITGNMNTPNVVYELSSPEVIFKQFILSDLKAVGQLHRDSQFSGDTTVRLSKLISNDLEFFNLDLQASGSEERHQLSLSSEGKPASGTVNLEGSWKNQQWRGQLLSSVLNTPLDTWTLQKPLSITALLSGTTHLSEHCWLSVETSLCFEEAELSAQQGSIHFQLSEFDSQRLSLFFPDDFNWHSTLSSEGQLAWQGKQPIAKLHLQTTSGTISTGEVSFDYSILDLDAEFNNNALISAFTFQSQSLGTARLNLSVGDVMAEKTLTGHLSLEKMKLDFLAPFIPEVSAMDGELSAYARLAGTLDKPLLYGDVSLTHGKVSTVRDIVSINDMTTRLHVQGDHGEIDGQLLLGDGLLAVGGYLNWQNMPPSGEISIKGENLGFQYPGMLRAKVSPDLELKLGESMALTGQLVIPEANIAIKDLPKNAVKVSEDAIIISNNAPEAHEQKPPFDININVILGQNIKVDAYGLTTGLTGNLQFVQENLKSMEANGSISLVNGQYRYLGQDLIIQEGTIIFSGPVATPYLAMNAIRAPSSIVDDTKVGVKVDGTVAEPDWEVYSVPPMSQQEQLSYLLRGRGLENGDNSSLESTLLGLGINQLGGVVSTLGEAIGLSDVSLDTQGSGDDTQVTIGGNIGPGLRLSYGAGVFNSLAEIKIRYELMPRLYLQAISGLAQAVDLFYQFQIDPAKN